MVHGKYPAPDSFCFCTVLLILSTIEYPNYKLYFSFRALGRFDHEYVPALERLGAGV
jgi:hypothetical protein